MAQTATYSSLVALIEALAGCDFQSDELARIKALINRRAKKAYRACDYWENWLVVDEQRKVNADKVVPYDIDTTDADTFHRIGAGALFDRTSEIEYEFLGVGGGAKLVNYQFSYGDGATFNETVLVNGVGFTISLSDAGNSPDPFPVALEVGDKIKVAGTPGGLADGEFTLSGVSYGTNALALTVSDTTIAVSAVDNNTEFTVSIPTVYATYKKRLAVTYGDGVSETSDIPEEWFEYIAHGAYADFCRAEGMNETALLEEQFAKDHLEEEIGRVYAQKVAQSIGNRVSTHASRQARLSAVR